MSVSSSSKAPIRVLVVLPERPDVSHSGDGIQIHGILAAVSGLGNVLPHILALDELQKRYDFEPPELNSYGDVHVLGKRPNTFFSGVFEKALLWVSRALGIGDFLVAYSRAKQVRDYAESIGAELVLGYHWHAAFATVKVEARRLLLVGDPLGRNAIVRRKIENSSGNWLLKFLLEGMLLFLNFLNQRLIVWATKSAEVRAFSAFHSAELSLLTKRQVSFVRTPYPTAGKKSGFRRSTVPGPKHVLLLGQLRGTATIQGLVFFQNEVLPHLLGPIADGALEIRVAGGPDEATHNPLWKGMKDAGVKFLGHVFPPSEELNRASVVVVPTSVPLGNRVRILTFWEHGVPVVAHLSNQAGIPELCHRYNSLLPENGRQMARSILDLLEQPALGKLIVQGGSETLRNFYGVDQLTSVLASVVFEIGVNR